MLFSFPFVALALGGETTLATEYSAEQKLQITTKSVLELEVTAMEMERDGEPMEARGGGGGPTTTERNFVLIDQVVEAEDGTPTKVERTFEEIGGISESDRGGETRERDLESPFAGLIVELTANEGEVEIAVTDGSEPSHDGALEGHRLELALDALLPAGGVEDGASWELSSDAVRRALGLDLRKAYFPPPDPEEFEGGGGGRRGGGRGGARGGRGGGQDPMGDAEFEGEATLSALDEEYEGVACAVIDIECSAEGEIEERDFGGGGGRRGRMPFAPFSNGLEPLVPLFETTFEVELEGKLYFDVAAKRPLHFEVEGQVSIERDIERTFNDRTMSIYMMTEGEFTMTTDIAEAE